MHFSDYIKSTLLAIIDKIAADPRKFVVNPGKDFTRNRKMGFRDTLLMLLTMEGDCIKEELYRYFGRIPEAPSKSAFYRQRRKLNTQALANMAVPMDYLDEAHSEYDISLRVVRFEISPGSFENIITNLPDIEFDFEDFKDLYHLR